jgi:NADP-dependent aldehyde dehydrogenase
MLTDGMAAAHQAWYDRVAGSKGTKTTSSSPSEPLEPSERTPIGRKGYPFAVRVDAEHLTDELLEEHFGPTAVIAAADPADYLGCLAKLEGQLTATILAAEEDHEAAARLLPALAGKAGRVVWNNVPTGVAVVEAMEHGGPWPATSASWSTSVGTEAVRRFVRPVALQGVPEELIT